MFTLDTFVLVKCTYFIVWISDGPRGYGLCLISLCFALIVWVSDWGEEGNYSIMRRDESN